MDQLDQDAVNLAKAIRQTESGGNFQARGKSGEYGAYQFTPPTWDSYSKKYGVNTPLEQATPEQQNEVAYKQIKEWKDKGYNPGQIASMWNSGKPDAYLDTNYKGVNDHGVTYDVPKYAKSVATAYQTIKNGGQPQADLSNPSSVDTGGYKTQPVLSKPTGVPQPAQEEGIISQLGGRLKDASTAISETAGGKINPVSGVLQTAGAVAGGVGDVVNKAIELIPGVKAIEGVIGKGVEQLAQTEGGKAIIASMQDFGQKHPELSKDIGAVFNIATAIPILKGLGVVKNVVLDSASLALKNTAEKVANKELTSVLTRTISGKRALAQEGENVVKTLVDERAIPDIEAGRYTTKDAFDNLSQKISAIEDGELQPTLARVSTQNVADRQSLENLRKEAIANIRKEMKGTGDSLKAEREINAKFDGFKNEYGDYVTLQDVNDMKRGVRTTVNFNSPKLDSDVAYHLGQVFQKNIENVATKMGLGDVKAINQKMARLIKAQNILKHVEGKPVKTGLVGGLIKDTATVGGEIAGNATGIPLAGAYLGREAGGFVGKKLAGISKGILDRTGKDIVREGVKSRVKKVGKMTAGALAQKANQK